MDGRVHEFVPPHLDPPDWGDAKPVAEVAVERGRILLRGDSNVVRLAKQVMPGARERRGDDHWTLSAPANRRTAAEISWLGQRFPLTYGAGFEEYRSRAVEHARRALAAEEAPPISCAPGFVGDLERYPWQGEDVARMVANPKCLNGLEMGLGKTVEGIAAVAAAGAFPALVICPPHIQGQWVRELGVHLEIEPPGALPGISRMPAGRFVHQVKGLSPYDLPDVPLFVTHYGLLRGWAQELSQISWGAVIFDECQELRIPGSQKYNAASVIAANAQNCWGLSGTPVYNYGSEIWAIMDVIDRGCLGAWQDFAVQWCDNDDQKLVTRPRELSEHLRREGLFFRRRKRDLLPHLPPKRRVVVDLAMDEGVYASEIAAARRLAQEIGNLDSAMTFRRAALLRLETGARQAAGLAKVGAAVEFLAGLIESGESPLVAAHHHAVHEALMEGLTAYRPVRITGQESTRQKSDAVDSFAAGRAGAVIIGLRSSTGLDGLQARATCTVAVELDWSPAVHVQFEDRAHRIGSGQHEELPCYYLTSSATYDELVLEVLGVKAAQARGLMDDPEAEESRAESQRRAAERTKRLVARLAGDLTEPEAPLPREAERGILSTGGLDNR